VGTRLDSSSTVIDMTASLARGDPFNGPGQVYDRSLGPVPGRPRPMPETIPVE
jgi:hypothetical protein